MFNAVARTIEYIQHTLDQHISCKTGPTSITHHTKTLFRFSNDRLALHVVLRHTREPSHGLCGVLALCHQVLDLTGVSLSTCSVEVFPATCHGSRMPLLSTIKESLVIGQFLQSSIKRRSNQSEGWSFYSHWI